VKKALAIGFAAALVAAGGFVLYHYNAMGAWLTTPKGSSTEPVALDIPLGTSVRGALQLLVQVGLVTPSPYIRYIGKVGEPLPAIHAGEYEFSPAQSPREMLRRMAEGKVKTHPLTVPPGLTVAEIGPRVAHAGFDAKGEFAALAADETFVASLGLPQLEGYLLPETYRFAKGAGARQVIETMAGEFKKQVTPAMEEAAKADGFDLNQVATMASIVEKEAGGPDEFKLIASVIRNRLKRGMPLQMDPTVIYGVKNFDGNLTRKQLETDHPWNTYTRAGLPPSPICNPSFGALEAAVYPAKTDFLFFVSMNNGAHKFSATLAEHAAAVRKYQVQGKVGP